MPKAIRQWEAEARGRGGGGWGDRPAKLSGNESTYSYYIVFDGEGCSRYRHRCCRWTEQRDLIFIYSRTCISTNEHKKWCQGEKIYDWISPGQYFYDITGARVASSVGLCCYSSTLTECLDDGQSIGLSCAQNASHLGFERNRQNRRFEIGFQMWNLQNWRFLSHITSWIDIFGV